MDGLCPLLPTEVEVGARGFSVVSEEESSWVVVEVVLVVKRELKGLETLEELVPLLLLSWPLIPEEVLFPLLLEGLSDVRDGKVCADLTTRDSLSIFELVVLGTVGVLTVGLTNPVVVVVFLSLAATEEVETGVPLVGRVVLVVLLALLLVLNAVSGTGLPLFDRELPFAPENVAWSTLGDTS